MIKFFGHLGLRFLLVEENHHGGRRLKFKQVKTQETSQEEVQEGHGVADGNQRAICDIQKQTCYSDSEAQ